MSVWQREIVGFDAEGEQVCFAPSEGGFKLGYFLPLFEIDLVEILRDLDCNFEDRAFEAFLVTVNITASPCEGLQDIEEVRSFVQAVDLGTCIDRLERGEYLEGLAFVGGFIILFFGNDESWLLTDDPETGQISTRMQRLDTASRDNMKLLGKLGYFEAVIGKA